MQLFRKYKKELSMIILVTFLQSFVFEVFIAYSKSINQPYYSLPYLPLDLENDLNIEDVDNNISVINTNTDVLTLGKSNYSSEESENLINKEESSTLYLADTAMGIIGKDAKLPYGYPNEIRTIS